MTNDHRKLLSNELKNFIEQRIETLRKIELAEEVDLNSEWTDMFKANPDLMILLGRTPTIDSLVAQNPELQAVMDLNPKFSDMIYANPNLKPNEFQDFILSNSELHDFVQDNPDLKDLLEARAVEYQKNKAASDSQTDEIDLGPMYIQKYDKLLKTGVIISIDFPDKM